MFFAYIPVTFVNGNNQKIRFQVPVFCIQPHCSVFSLKLIRKKNNVEVETPWFVIHGCHALNIPQKKIKTSIIALYKTFVIHN